MSSSLREPALSQSVGDLQKYVRQLERARGRDAVRIMKAEALRSQYEDLRRIVCDQRLEIHRLLKCARIDAQTIRRYSDKILELGARSK